MLIKTDQAKHSGAGTAMFSKSGKVTIVKNVLFKQ